MMKRLSSSVQIQRPEVTSKFAYSSPEIPVEQHLASDSVSWLFHAVAALLGLFFFSPLFLLIVLAIKLTDSGPIFYRGRRVGRDGHIFWIYKFRTLCEGAEKEIGARLLSDDDRARYCTKIGKFLKRSKLDELPQLVNVLRGEMRLAGPRPVRPIFLRQFEQEIPNYAARFRVPPGITGIAQLRGGYYTSPRNKLRYDLIYIRNRSLMLDVKLVLLTFIKILDRWLTLGFFLCFLFLFVSFVPPSVQSFWAPSWGGGGIGLVHLAIILITGWSMLRSGLTRFSLYRGPLNMPMLLFVLFGVLSALCAEEPAAMLYQTGHYVITGFLVSFFIINSLATRTFITVTVRVIALTSVVISVLGLFQVFLVNYPTAAESLALSSGTMVKHSGRVSSILGSPVVLSVYLVLSIPLLLSEVIRARNQTARDFWLVCTTLSFVGIFFTQTRIGLLALCVTGAVFLYRRLIHIFSFLAIFLLGFLFVVSLGVPRFSLPELYGEATRWVQQHSQVLHTVPLKRWLIGERGALSYRFTAAPPNAGVQQSDPIDIPNMHITLILEHGIIGWLLMMWLICSALWAMKRACTKTHNERLKSILWAIIASGLGFLLSMNVMNTFHHLTLQIFFWSLIGIGLGIVVRLNGTRRYDLIWQFGDPGD